MNTLGLSAEDADKGAAAHVPRVKSSCCWSRNSGGSRPSSASRLMSSWTSCADIATQVAPPPPLSWLGSRKVPWLACYHPWLAGQRSRTDRLDVNTYVILKLYYITKILCGDLGLYQTPRLRA
eukprot:scaffold71007_cov71-Phaeocystis_antarctica.AAC.2